MKWKNINRSKSELIRIARQKVQILRPDAGPKRVLVLGPQYETNFLKGSPRGMLSSKQYVDISSLNVNNAQDLSAKLNGLVWSDIGK
ncbi:hypothetical protein [Vibrio sp.]|uniref:hypothetical protein n=1 Tax=Vibrio sp. TaxID=678 RepID=UPI003D121FB2